MEEIIRPWTAEESLAELSLHRDWDYMASMISSLRIYLFDHGTVPTWNFLLCGGRPELAIPATWAYAWPSAFAYLLPPNQAIIAVWLVLSALGFAAAFLLLKRWTGSALGAFTGAWIYVLGGFFAVRFNLGQVGFAFFHLIPLIMLLFERALDERLAGGRAVGPIAWLALASFLFFTAALPHGLIFFYPAVILLVTFRLWAAARSHGVASSAAAGGVVLTAHAIGLWVAAYRVWPPVRWQLAHPRAHVLPERYTLWQIFENTVRLVPDYFGPWRTEPWHIYPSAGYNAYVGPLPWLLALAVPALLIAAARRGEAPRAKAPVAYATAVLVAGLVLALGNDHPWAPGSFFARLPVLGGVRAFNRYQILTVFALAILSALAIACLRELPGRWWRPLAALVALSTCALILVQAGLLVWNIEAVPRAKSLAVHRAAERPDPPQLIWMRHTLGPSLAPEERTVLIEGGYWIANCKEDIQIRELHAQRPVGVKEHLTIPPPARLVKLSRERLVLSYARPASGPAGEGGGTVRWQLPHLRSFRYNARPLAPSPVGGVAFAMADLPEGELAVTARYAGPAEGAVASVAGLGAALVFFAWLRWGRLRPIKGCAGDGDRGRSPSGPS